MNLTRIGGALLAVALPFAVTGVAGADPRTSFTLILSSSDGSTEVKLECEPAGGTHPDAKSACAELHRAQGDFDALADHQESANCTMEYRPVTAEARGEWHGNPADWRHDFGNDCTLRMATGVVFAF